MISVKSEIYKCLKKVNKNVTDGYPKDWEDLPIVVYLEEENRPYEITDDTERSSEIKYIVHIWSIDSNTDLAIKVNEVFAKLGLKRVSSQDVADNERLRHKVMRFEGIIDIETLMIYQRRYTD